MRFMTMYRPDKSTAEAAPPDGKHVAAMGRFT